MQGLRMDVTVQHKLRAMRLQNLGEPARVAEAAMPAGLGAEGGMVDQHDAKQPRPGKIVERTGEKLPLNRTDLACGDERHGGNGGGKSDERDIAGVRTDERGDRCAGALACRLTPQRDGHHLHACGLDRLRQHLRRGITGAAQHEPRTHGRLIEGQHHPPCIGASTSSSQALISG